MGDEPAVGQIIRQNLLAATLVSVPLAVLYAHFSGFSWSGIVGAFGVYAVSWVAVFTTVVCLAVGIGFVFYLVILGADIYAAQFLAVPEGGLNWLQGILTLAPSGQDLEVLLIILLGISIAIYLSVDTYLSARYKWNRAMHPGYNAEW